MYKDVRYANQRLTGTVISRLGLPTYIMDCVMRGGKIHLACIDVGGELPKEEPLEEFDLTPIPLGNINYQGKACYLMRIPMRNDWRQGARPNNLMVRTHRGQRVDKALLLKSKALVKCVQNDYPSFDECLDSLVNDEAESMAFSKKFSLSKGEGGVSLCYRGPTNTVGNVSNSRPVLLPKYEYLNESLQEVL